MGFIAVDLGSTNIKVAVYNTKLECIARSSKPVAYDRVDGFVEFDACRYVAILADMIAGLAFEIKQAALQIKQIVFTGQAESLVVLDETGSPLMNAISWMDERSFEECNILKALFPNEEYEAVTGQLAILPTWPATKILWLRRHKPEVFARAAKYMLLKDYVVYSFTEKMLADCSIATFSFYFDIYQKCYWPKMLDACGITEDQLPPLVEPCSIAGTLTACMADRIGLPKQVKVNVGTLDHFAGMIGTGNVQEGGISLSTGTVMALATMAPSPVPAYQGIAMHYGFIPDTYVMLPVAESGGVCLEWFRNACLNRASYSDMDKVIEERAMPNDLIFLPYIAGTNAPEFDSNASGVFYGLKIQHDTYDMAYAVMEGVAFLLKKNCDDIKEKGTNISCIIATGGGAKSALWCQIQADVTGLNVIIPREKEAACFGAAIIGAVSDGVFRNFDEAVKQTVKYDRMFKPRCNALLERKYRQFCRLYDAALQIAEIH